MVVHGFSVDTLQYNTTWSAVPLQFSVSWKRVSAYFRHTHPVCLLIPIMLIDHVSFDPPSDLPSLPPSAGDRQTCHCRSWWQGILLHGWACEPAWSWPQSPQRRLTPPNTLGHGHTDTSTHRWPSLLLSCLCLPRGRETSSELHTFPAPSFKWGQGGKNTEFVRAGPGELLLVVCKMVRN